MMGHVDAGRLVARIVSLVRGPWDTVTIEAWIEEMMALDVAVAVDAVRIFVEAERFRPPSWGDFLAVYKAEVRRRYDPYAADRMEVSW